MGLYATIDVADSVIEEVPFEVAHRPFAFKIRRVSAHWNPSVCIFAVLNLRFAYHYIKCPLKSNLFFY